MSNAILLDKGMKILANELGLVEAEKFVFLLLSQPFDYTEWRRNNLFFGMSIDEISESADNYCKNQLSFEQKQHKALLKS
ncbi:MAG: hypothetical protein LBN95_01925 [Prevotellaceae bacterium]|jgi:hypothetical protein|nr:hypothetical protein [Prevotellaceae bacterium]